MTTVYPEKEYKEFLSQGKFKIQRSRATGRYFFYPRVAEPGTGCTDIEWVEPSGIGHVYSFTIVRKKPPEKDYNVVLVDLAEGPRMMSRVEGIENRELRIGLEVRVKVVSQDGKPVVVFTPVHTKAGEAMQ